MKFAIFRTADKVKIMPAKFWEGFKKCPESVRVGNGLRLVVPVAHDALESGIRTTRKAGGMIVFRNE